MSISATYHHYQGFHPTSASNHNHPGCEQRRFESRMDISMQTTFIWTRPGTIIRPASVSPRVNSKESSSPKLVSELPLASMSKLISRSYIHNLRLLPLRLPHPHPPQSPNQLPQQGRPLPPHGPRRNHRLPLHRPHSPQLAERNRRSDLDLPPRLVLALVGSLLRHCRRVHTNPASRLQMARGQTPRQICPARQSRLEASNGR